MDDVHLTLSTVVQHSLVPFDCCTWRQRAGRLAAGPHVMAQCGDLFISLFKSTHVVTTSPPAKAQIKPKHLLSQQQIHYGLQDNYAL